MRTTVFLLLGSALLQAAPIPITGSATYDIDEARTGDNDFSITFSGPGLNLNYQSPASGLAPSPRLRVGDTYVFTGAAPNPAYGLHPVTVGNISSPYFQFSVGQGNGYVELYDSQHNTLVHQDVYGWAVVTSTSYSQLAPVFGSASFTILDTAPTPEPSYGLGVALAGAAGTVIRCRRRGRLFRS